MNRFKIVLDVVMMTLMIILMKLDVLGLQAHEIIGITIFVLFIIHKVINYKFVKAIGKNIFSKKIKLDSKILFILDVVLFCFMLLNILTGVLISRFIFSELMVTNVRFVTILHEFFAWWTLILISIHIGLHLERLVKYSVRNYKFFKDNKTIKVIVLIIYLSFALLGIRSLCKYSIYSKIIPTLNNPNQHIQERKYKNQKDTRAKEIPTLDEYLSQFTCGECRKKCSLLHPQCNIGKQKREEKVNEYYRIYGDKIEDDLNDNEIRNKEPFKNDGEENYRKFRNRSNVLDVINIIVLFTGGTYFIEVLVKDNKKKNSRLQSNS